jgi:DNA-binding CsgD family transcriptional regulator
MPQIWRSDLTDRAYPWPVSAYAMERAAERIARLATRGLDAVSFFREAQEALLAAVPATPPTFWHTLDPASLLITSSLDEEGGPTPHEVLEWEYFVDDVMKTVDAARDPRGLQILEEVTRGDPTSSPLYQAFLGPAGIEHAVEVALRGKDGHVWGSVTLMRETGRPGLSPTELGFLTTVAPDLARGAHRGLLVGEATEPEGPDAPGLVVVTDTGEVASLTPGMDRWLAELPGRWDTDGALPDAVVAVASRALATAETPDAPGEVAVARVLSQAGRWVVLHGAAMVATGTRRAAVIIEPAHPARITPLLMDAYELTEREQDVTRLVLRGDSTTQIAQRLFVSPNTVQGHLKSIFDKTGVRSRRDLIGKVFFSHYEPRVRDNDQRMPADRPIRGGPFPVDRTPPDHAEP